MKKIIVYSVSVLLAFGLQACKAKPVPQPELGIAGETTEVATLPEDQNVEGKVQHMNTEQFVKKIFDFRAHTDEFVYAGTMPCIVDFYATWCGPCKRLSPIMDELAKDYAGKIAIYKIDVDKEKELSAAFGIQSIPTMLFIPAEGMPAMQAGLMNKAQLVQIIESFLLKNGD